MSRAEPRSMTLVDTMALVLGIALAFVALPGRSFFLHVPAVWILAFFGLVDLIRGLSLAVSLVVLGRLMRYRRMPRPSEWLAVLITASTLAGRQELNVDGYVNRLYAAFPDPDRLAIHFGGWRWEIAGVELALIAAGLAMLRFTRGRLPGWSKALALAALATLAIAGPLFVFGLQGADLISPSGGFGPGIGSILLRKACWLAAQVPLGLIYGIPAYMASAERVAGERWAWTEWAGASFSLELGVISVIFDRNEFPVASREWLAELALSLAWLIGVFFLSRSSALRFGPACRRWIGEEDQRRGSSRTAVAPSPGRLS